MKYYFSVTYLNFLMKKMNNIICQLSALTNINNKHSANRNIFTFLFSIQKKFRAIPYYQSI
ncbi:protein of unknown function [Bartonella clarridgeiae 73]|uniref:Uncharacterized protein n=1 Tax=Bartonella clarridgeiae (strain CCUG 45776 / CIP 104772 / 73) TaxID=696125 RepID=E6YHF3_BARC7|nr:protein of unknown function [Bartonella clarridgeiae 73]